MSGSRGRVDRLGEVVDVANDFGVRDPSALKDGDRVEGSFRGVLKGNEKPDKVEPGLKKGESAGEGAAVVESLPSLTVSPDKPVAGRPDTDEEGDSEGYSLLLCREGRPGGRGVRADLAGSRDVAWRSKYVTGLPEIHSKASLCQ